jgi:DNA-binding transcriptional ArsR family regulator
LHAESPNVLGKLSYVLASRQREKVLAAVVPGPQTPGQIAKQTGLHLSHVSRTLGELARTDLVTCLSGERRGKLYAASNLGHAVFAELADSRGDRLISPMARGSHFRNYLHWITAHYGREAADEVLIEIGMDPAHLDVEGWYPLRAALDVLDLIEARFGDGTYDTIRRMVRDEIGNFPSLRRLVNRGLPVPIFLELTPNAYAREYNHGRLEVDVQDGRAVMRYYDWMSSPARCAARLGVYEGTLALLGVKGTVTKVACMLRGAPYCGYRLDW